MHPISKDLYDFCMQDDNIKLSIDFIAKNYGEYGVNKYMNEIGNSFGYRTHMLHKNLGYLLQGVGYLLKGIQDHLSITK